MDTLAHDNAQSGLPEDYDAFYEANIGPALQAMEGERQRVIRLGKRCLIAGLVGLGLALAGGSTGMGLTIVIIGFVLMCGSIVIVAIPSNRLHKKTKQALITPTCEFLGYSYHPEAREFDIEDFVAAGLIRSGKRITKLREDRIAGHEKGIPFELCEAKVERRGSGEDSNTTLFKGLLFRCRFNKAFTGATFVMGGSGRGKVPETTAGGTPVEQVHLEESDFSRLYKTWGSDQVEARYLLTPGFMEHMVALAEHFAAPNLLKLLRQDETPDDDQLKRANVSAAFVDDELLLAINDHRDRFEAGQVFKAVPGRERAEELVRQLALVTAIIDTLNLTDNTRAG